MRAPLDATASHLGGFDHPFKRGWVTTVQRRASRLVVWRSATDPEFRARLVHTAGVLATIRTPGTEALVELRDGPTATTLVTTYAGGRSLATIASVTVAGVTPDPAAVARQAVMVFSTLAQLHACGVTHGPFRREHIRLCGDQVVLCSFDDAVLRTSTDPETWHARCALDIASAARTLVDFLNGAPDRVDARPLYHDRPRPSLRFPRMPTLRNGRRIVQALDAIASHGSLEATAAVSLIERLAAPKRAATTGRRAAAAAAAILLVIGAVTGIATIERFTRSIPGALVQPSARCGPGDPAPGCIVQASDPLTWPGISKRAANRFSGLFGVIRDHGVSDPQLDEIGAGQTQVAGRLGGTRCVAVQDRCRAFRPDHREHGVALDQQPVSYPESQRAAASTFADAHRNGRNPHL